MIVALAALGSSVSSARAAEEPKAFEARITTELEAKNAEAAALFRKANEARERGDMASARDLYSQVHEKMTDEIRDRLVIHGVVIPKPGDKPAEEDTEAA